MDAQLPAVEVAARPECEIIAPRDRSIRVSAQLRPFNSDLVQRSYPAGITLAEILADLQPSPMLRACSHVFVSGDRVPAELLHRVRPKPGRQVDISCVPQFGGGKKSPLRFLLTLVVAAASLLLPAIPALGGAVFAGGTLTWGGLAGAATPSIGPFLVDARRPELRS